jgi:hypothetical protein
MAGLGERRKRLIRLAQLLERPPERPPYYLSRGSVSTPEPAAGWYIVLAGAELPTYLGQGAIDAEVSLRRLIDRQEAIA